MQTVAQRLVERLGARAVLTDTDQMAPWLSDWRGIYAGRAQAIVRPENTAAVADCIRICFETGTPVVPRGGNTGLCGGATPDDNPANVVLSLDRMSAIRSIDATGNIITAEAGCVLGNLRRAAAAENRLLPLSLAAEDSCQLGGNLSTNAGGVNVVRYGMARELVVGLEAVLPDGAVLNALRTMRKDNTGYDLKQLLIGAEGTLGVITAASLKLYPRNDSRVTVLAGLAGAAEALGLFRLAYDRCGDRIQAFEFFTDACLDMVLAQVPGVTAPFAERYQAYVLMELADSAAEASLRSLIEEIMGRALELELCGDAVVSQSIAQLAAMWRLREEISEAQRADGPHLKHDVSLPTAAIPAFLETAAARVRGCNPDVRLVVFGHFGDGNLHYNVSRPRGAADAFLAAHGGALTDAILDEVARYGGSISAEHGIGRLKRRHFERYKDPLELDLMRRIKHVLDPKGIMNPGKLL